jgi:hypothetical protein
MRTDVVHGSMCEQKAEEDKKRFDEIAEQERKRSEELERKLKEERERVIREEKERKERTVEVRFFPFALSRFASKSLKLNTPASR